MTSRLKIPARITVEIDSREKLPLLFPETITYFGRPHIRVGARLIEVRTRAAHLSAGDYRLADYRLPDGRFPSLVERKLNLRELASNFLTDDRTRALAAFARFHDATPAPYLLFEEPFARALTPTPDFKAPALALDELFRVTVAHGLRFLWLGDIRRPASRRRAGALLVHLLLTHALHEAPSPEAPEQNENL